MRVRSVEAFPVRVKAEERLKGGTFSYASYQAVIVRAEVDGVQGWGEAMTRFDPGATALLVRYFGKTVEGKEWDGEGSAWEAVWRELRIRGHTRGTDVEALSGIDIALHDCRGKLERKPLGRILSGRAAGEVPAFAGSLFESRGPLETQVAASKAKGLSGAKVKVGFGVEEDSRLLRRVRALWEDGMLVADANGAYDSSTALRACDAFSDLDLAWFEEPVLSDDVAGYRALKGARTRIGAGESWFPGDFHIPLAEGLVGVVEPSVSRCGGVKVEAEVAREAAARGISFSPMTGMNSGVSVAASIHVASAFRSAGVEFNPFANPLQTELVRGLPEPKGGRVEVPAGDGLGVEVDERFLKEHGA